MSIEKKASDTKQVKETLEEIAFDPENRKFLEQLWCKIHKAGSDLPSSEELFRIISLSIPTEEQKIDPREFAWLNEAIRGLYLFYQLALVKERM